MKFYNVFAKYYNKIFPLDKDLAESLILDIKGKKLLDVGCGTGEYAKYFAEKGYQVDAFDLSSKMIQIAKKENPKNINFFIDDMTTYQKEQAYDLIYCIGSTIAHINSRANIKTFIENAYISLKENGIIKIKSLNYYYLFANNITRIEDLTSDDNHIKLERRFAFNNGQVQFKTKLTTKENNYEDTTPLIKISKELLVEILTELAISDYEFSQDEKNIFLTIYKLPRGKHQ